MSFLNTGFTPTVSARLTKAGRNAIAKGDFLISYFSIGDSEYNYNPDISGLTSQRVFAPFDKNTHVKYPFLYSATGSTIYGIPVESPDDENQPCRNVMEANSGWTLNTVWENKPLGINDSIALKDYQSNVYSGVKSYLGYTSSSGQTFINYSGGPITGTTIRNTMLEEVEILPEEQNSIAILHYSESGTTADPYKFFKYDDYISNHSGTTTPNAITDIDYFEVSMSNLMYHRLGDATTGTTFHMSTGKTKSVTSEYNSDFQLDYVDLLDVNEYSVGKIFFNQKIIVFDDQEIVAVLDTGSTRNYTLTAPKVSSYITNADPIVDLTTGKTLWVTYVLSGGTVSGDLPCSYFMKVTGTTNDENVTVKFNSGEFKHLNSGYTATEFHILHQFTDNGEQPDPNQWYSKNYTSELSSINDLKNGFTFTLNETKINDAESRPPYVSSLTNFGKERTYTEGTVSTVIGTDVQVMNFVINLPDGKFTDSQNPTYVSGTKYITEIALLNSNKETMVVGKFSAPRARTTSVDVFSVKLDF
jgi:hypothetical protein